MNKELTKTFGHAGIYTVGIILNRAVSFVMLPIYTRYLTPSDYGVLELLEMTVDVVITLTALGIHQGFFKFYYAYEADNDRKELVSTVFIMSITLLVLSTVAFGTASSGISHLVFGSEQYSHFVLISFINMFFQFLLVLSLGYLRVQYKSLLFVVINGLKLALQLFLNIVFVIHFKMGIIGVLYSTMIASLIIGIGMTSYVLLGVGLRFSKYKAVELLKFGFPFIISSYGAFILTFSDRYFLNYYRTLSDVGTYSLAYKFGFLLMTFPVLPLHNIWMAQRFELVKKVDYEETFNRYLSWFCIITLTVGLVISMEVRDVLRAMSAPAFWEAYKVVPIIVLAYFMQGCTDIFNFGIHYSGKTKHMAYGTGLAAFCIIALSFLLIPRYGAVGAAWATLISFIVRLFYVYYASQKLFRVNYKLGRPLGTLIISVLMYLIYLGASQFSGFNTVYVSSTVALCLLFLFSMLLVSFNIIKADEKRILINSLKSPIRTFSEIKNQLAS